MVSTWVIITIPESATSLALCEVEAYGAPIRSEVLFYFINDTRAALGRTDSIRRGETRHVYRPAVSKDNDARFDI